MKKITLIVLFLIATKAMSVQPVDGLWFDPNISGTGASIEVINGTMIFTYYAYDSSGNSQWWQGIAHETFKGSDTYQGQLNGFKDGQCVGCPYTQPSLDEANSLNSFSVNFASTTVATLSWAGGVNTFSRFNYSFPNYEDQLFGI